MQLQAEQKTIIVTFAGHRDVCGNRDSLENDIYAYLAGFAENGTAIRALTGGMGDFDGLCSAAVRRIKRTFPMVSVNLALVAPYMKQEYNTNREYYETQYDELIIFSSQGEYHPKRVITERNRWMVDQADILLTYVYRDFGGAQATVSYAKKKDRCSIIPFHR